MMNVDSELKDSDVLDAILAVFPAAEIGADEDGQLVIYTNCMWSGNWPNQTIIGEMNIGAEYG